MAESHECHKCGENCDCGQYEWNCEGCASCEFGEDEE